MSTTTSEVSQASPTQATPTLIDSQSMTRAVEMLGKIGSTAAKNNTVEIVTKNATLTVEVKNFRINKVNFEIYNAPYNIREILKSAERITLNHRHNYQAANETAIITTLLESYRNVEHVCKVVFIDTNKKYFDSATEIQLLHKLLESEKIIPQNQDRDKTIRAINNLLLEKRLILILQNCKSQNTYDEFASYKAQGFCCIYDNSLINKQYFLQHAKENNLNLQLVENLLKSLSKHTNMAGACEIYETVFGTTIANSFNRIPRINYIYDGTFTEETTQQRFNLNNEQYELFKKIMDLPMDPINFDVNRIVERIKNATITGWDCINLKDV